MYFILIVIPAVLLDRLSKLLVMGRMALSESIPLWEGVFHITYIHNEGAAFSMLSGRQAFLQILTALLMLAILLYLLFAGRRSSRLTVVALSLILAGGLGNLWDRVLYGWVPDFLDFRLIHFAVFNVADIFVTLGCALLFLEVLLLEPRRARREGYRR